MSNATNVDKSMMQAISKCRSFTISAFAAVMLLCLEMELRLNVTSANIACMR